jgi:type IV secretory pathway TrbL component
MVRRFLGRRFVKPLAALLAAVVGVGAAAYAMSGGATFVSDASAPAALTTVTAGSPSAGGAWCALASSAGRARKTSRSASSAASSGFDARHADHCRRPLLARLRALLRRAEHVELIVRGKGGSWVTIVADRGTVTALSATSIVISRPDGVSVTAALTAATRFPRGGRQAVAVGDHVVVVQVGGTTRFVVRLGRLHPRTPAASSASPTVAGASRGSGGAPSAD